MTNNPRFGTFIRTATAADQAELEALIARSARALSVGDYEEAQVESALRGTFGVDTQIIRDGTYYIAERDGRIVGCGGWSRRTLFGGDSLAGMRDAGELDPARDAARIRAFFVAPEFARQGIGAAILGHCEADAIACGFRRFELVATLPGVRLYAAKGYRAGEPLVHRMPDGIEIPFIAMSKDAK